MVLLKTDSTQEVGQKKRYIEERLRSKYCIFWVDFKTRVSRLGAVSDLQSIAPLSQILHASFGSQYSIDVTFCDFHSIKISFLGILCSFCCVPFGTDTVMVHLTMFDIYYYYGILLSGTSLFWNSHSLGTLTPLGLSFPWDPHFLSPLISLGPLFP